MIIKETASFRKRENEDIKIVLRRHWACVMGLVFIVIAMGALPIIIYFILETFIYLSDGFFNIFVLGIGAYYMFIITLFFIGWLDYYLDVAIITNERIVDIDQNSLFNRCVSELNLSKIQDVTAEVKGVLPTMMNFGNVTVQTAGTQVDFVLDSIPHPYRIAKKILDIQQSSIEKLGKEKRAESNHNEV